MRWKLFAATALAALVAAPVSQAAKPSPALQAIMAEHPGGTLTPLPSPQYVYGQAYCYNAVLSYIRGTSGGLASEGLWVRPTWCAIPGLPPHIYSIDQGYRYQVCTGLIQCAGTAGPFLAAGGIGSAWADYEWVGYYRWSVSGLTASAIVHMVWELGETGQNWSYGWI